MLPLENFWGAYSLHRVPLSSYLLNLSSEIDDVDISMKQGLVAGGL
jgi:hypothetical protein